MAWPPLLSWILSSSESSSSSCSSDYEYDDVEDSKLEDHPQQQQQQNHDHNISDHDDDDVSYNPKAEEDQNSNSTSDYTFTVSEPSPKRRRIDRTITNEPLTPVQEETKRRRKRVWSMEDELELLRGFLDYYGTRQIKIRTTLTQSFYDEVKPKLKMECNKAQLVAKLRRLRRKYQNVLNQMNNIYSAGKEFRFKNSHDRVIFDLSHKIWSSKIENGNYSNIHDNDDVKVKKQEDNVGSSSVADHDHQRLTSGALTAQLRHTWSHSRLSTYDQENNNRMNIEGNGTSSFNTNNNVVDDNMGKNDVPGLVIGLAMNPMPLSLNKFGGGGGGGVEMVEDEKWRKQQILELEAYSKRLDLVQHQVKAALEELRSKGGAE